MGKQNLWIVAPMPCGHFARKVAAMEGRLFWIRC